MSDAGAPLYKDNTSIIIIIIMMQFKIYTKQMNKSTHQHYITAISAPTIISMPTPPPRNPHLLPRSIIPPIINLENHTSLPLSTVVDTITPQLHPTPKPHHHPSPKPQTSKPPSYQPYQPYQHTVAIYPSSHTNTTTSPNPTPLLPSATKSSSRHLPKAKARTFPTLRLYL